MSATVVALVLFAALLHATWNALVKGGGEPELTMTAIRLSGTVVCLFALPFVEPPARESWPMIIASVIIHNFYYFSMARAYRVGDLSQVYPIFRGLAPVLVTAGAALFAGEYLTPGTLVGIVLVSIGLSSLAFATGGGVRASRSAVGWGLATSLFIAGYTVVDGLGVRVSGNPIGYILWLFSLEVLPIGIIILLTRRAAFFAYLRSNPLVAIGGGVASSAAYGLVIFALGLGAMGMVSSLRETSVIFAAIIGSVFLKEPFGRRRIIAAGLVAAGVVLMHAL